MTIKHHVFTPSSFTINIGDTVKWTWVDGFHTTTSLTIPAGATSWDNAINSNTTSFSYVPLKTGTYNYKCTPHFSMGMKGSFTVVCPQASVSISAAGPAAFCNGGSVLLNSSVTSAITSYQWKKDGTNIAGATASTFTATKTGSYTLMVTNNCGNTATSAAITVKARSLPPASITPSGSVDICRGDTATLQAVAGASLTYQWIRSGAIIPGATSSTYKTVNGGSYKVQVIKTTTGCTKTSAVTKVTVVTCFSQPITKLYKRDISIYPNPSPGGFHISIPSFSGIDYSSAIYDAKGVQVESKRITSGESLLGSNLQSGIYFMEVKKGNIVIAKEKIVKQ